MGEVKRLSEVRSLSSASTTTAGSIRAANDSKAWVTCSGCSCEYLPHAILKDHLCFDCWKRRQAIDERVAQTFGSRTLLQRLALKPFVVTAENAKAHEACQSFDYKRDNLFLFGSVGTGKTHLACIAAMRIVEAASCAFIRPSEWLRLLRGRNGIEEQEEINKLVGVSSLVIDELGIEKQTEFAIQSLYDLIDARILREKNGLIITSNLSLGDLALKMDDDRLASRLGGMCQVIEITGRDWRQPE